MLSAFGMAKIRFASIWLAGGAIFPASIWKPALVKRGASNIYFRQNPTDLGVISGYTGYIPKLQHRFAKTYLNR